MLYYSEKSLVRGSLVIIIAGLFFYYNLIFNATEIEKVGVNINNYICSFDVGADVYTLIDDILTEDTTETVNLATPDTDEQIAEEIRLGEIELLAQLIEAEAGNQDYTGKKLVADVVLNRVDAGMGGDTIEEIIFADKQFAVIKDGAFDSAAWRISDDSFKAAYEEYNASVRYDSSVLYFTAGNYNSSGTPAYKHGDHYFSYG